MIRAATFTFGILAAQAASAACTDAAVDLRGDWGSARFNVEVADDPAERAQGLMNRPSMPASAGMLFVYDAPQRAIFWMKNTLIPLDMIFLDQTGTVTRVHENAVPLDETNIDGGPGVLAVLEINGGLASAIGIAEGSQLRHPALDQSIAAWPCD
jgi:hypothetical protein